MKKWNKYIAILFTCFTFGCSDLLDQEPVSITHPDVFWVNQDNAEQGLAGAYAHLKYAVTVQANFLFWGEFPGMTFLNSGNWIVNYIENNGDFVLPYRPNSRTWKDMYRAANWANTIEGKVEEMPVNAFDSEEDKNRIIGEAAFIRALSYFYMARVWGDVPIVTESIESADQLITEDGYIVSVERSDELEVLQHALDAADKAVSLLNYSTPGDANWAIRANKASAEALKAHIALWYASRDNGNTQMIEQAIQAATSVIENGNAELIDYVAEGVSGFDDMCIGQSKTGLFELNVSAGMDESFRILNSDSYYTGLTLNSPVLKNHNNNSADIDPDYYGKDFMNNDPDRVNDVRKGLFFFEFDQNEDSFLMKYAHGTQDPDSEDDYALFSESNILVFRLADIYLLRAEAYAKSGKPGLAVQDINAVRSKANVPDYTGATDEETLIKAIFEERAIELVGEGHGAFDRIRMNYYEGVSWVNQTRLTKEGYFWPIDPGIISANPKIVQNEFWRGKL